MQGVGYRAWIRRQALDLGLTGWVRNRTDGSVEILVAGENTAVDLFVKKCRTGPPGAHVTSVDLQDATLPQDHTGFERRPTE
ncbi:MAG: acylphosphatase [Pseudomonadota bacterium]|nr:acylphosphatase [Pseudomonadota bacterium]